MVNDPLYTENQYWRTFMREIPLEIVIPGPGQEFTSDYPCPPAVESVATRLQVWYAGILLAETTEGLRVLETSNPPVYYFPWGDVRMEFLTQMVHTTQCEWKGTASYWNASIRGRRQEAVGWSYDNPKSGYERLKEHLAFYPGLVDACLVGNERAQPQRGDYYGGWITSTIVGLDKSHPNTEVW